MSENDSEIIEELDGYEKTDVEMERPDEIVDFARPWDPTKIRVDTKVYSLRQIVDMANEGDLELAPDFQRKKVWGPVQQSRLIESILLRIPLPAFYFSADDEGRMQVVDGLQRISTICSFVKSEFCLMGLEYLQSETAGKLYSQLSSLWTRRIHSTQITANVVDPQTPDEVKFEIFKRINTGGSPLNSQEIRHCMSKSPSREFIKRLSSSEQFHTATGQILRDHPRMVDREVVLRFTAFRLYYEYYSEFDTLDSFLTHVTKQIDGGKISQEKLDNLDKEFNRSMNNAHRLFDKHAFRKWSIYDIRLNPFNRALFDSWSVILSDYEWSQLEPFAESIVNKSRKLLITDYGFADAITTSTNTAKRVELRFNAVKKILSEAMET